MKKKIRIVYISTDYVYPGDVGLFSEDDNLYPQNNYAWTKLAGESSTRLVKDHLIIRTSFGINKFPHKFAFTNLYTSKDYVDIIAPMVFDASISELIGTINIGTERKSIFEFANRRDIVPPSTISKVKDFSLNINKFKNLK